MAGDTNLEILFALGGLNCRLARLGVVEAIMAFYLRLFVSSLSEGLISLKRTAGEPSELSSTSRALAVSEAAQLRGLVTRSLSSAPPPVELSTRALPLRAVVGLPVLRLLWTGVHDALL